MPPLQVAYLLTDDPERVIKIEAIEVSDSIPASIPPSTPGPLPSLPSSPSRPTTPPPISRMPPPPIQLYDTPASAITSINAFAREHGYAVSILRSKNSRKGVKQAVYLCCVRGRSPQRRSTGSKSRAVDCPFALTLRLQKDTETWLLEIKDPNHNHLPSSPATHRVHRRVEMTPEIDKQLLRGYRPTQILAAVQKGNPDSALMVQDLYNRRIALFRDRRHGSESTCSPTPTSPSAISGSWNSDEEAEFLS